MRDKNNLQAISDAEIEQRVRHLTDLSRKWWRWPLAVVFVVVAGLSWSWASGYPPHNLPFAFAVASIIATVGFFRDRRFAARAQTLGSPDDYFRVFRDHVERGILRLQRRCRLARVLRVCVTATATLALLSTAFYGLPFVPVGIVALLMAVLSVVAVPLVDRRLAHQRAILAQLAT